MKESQTEGKAEWAGNHEADAVEAGADVAALKCRKAGESSQQVRPFPRTAARQGGGKA